MQIQSRLCQVHEMAAKAYEQVYIADLPAYYADLVHHYNQANCQNEERYYARLAGEQAAARFAHEDAIRFFDRAVALVSEADVDEHYHLLAAREQVHDVVGDRQR
ncbi:MAG: hypothetical protein GY779_12145 [Gammaproteobacteria bacterium]|nr:hypothetical protein [Gammaproteobacteria bacterium]